MIEISDRVIDLFRAQAEVNRADARTFNAKAKARDQLCDGLTRDDRDAAAFVANAVLRLVGRFAVLLLVVA